MRACGDDVRQIIVSASLPLPLTTRTAFPLFLSFSVMNLGPIPQDSSVLGKRKESPAPAHGEMQPALSE